MNNNVVPEPRRRGRERMTLAELIGTLETTVVYGDDSVEITSITMDSRTVGKGSLFFAVRGFTADGNRFIPQAIDTGAVAVMTEDPKPMPGITCVGVPDVRKAMSLIANRFYGEPQNQLVMTGITGTNGKTTTTYLVRSIFRAAGLDCGVIGTISHIVGGDTIRAKNTTPEATDIHAYLAQMVAAGQEACAMEVSSHALALSRVNGIHYRAAAFLNLTRDHLDFHGDYRNYLDAKSLLFFGLSGDATAVINGDDEHADHIASNARDAHILRFGAASENEIHPVSAVYGPRSTELILSTPAGEIECTLPIPGKFNVFNAMAATGIALGCGIQPDVIARGLADAEPVRGRYELIDVGQPFVVVVDYAHTPDALERVLSTARELSEGRIISVFGCGGDRDRGKRPEMGEVAARLADITVITSDNPRSEDPDAIITVIIDGMPDDVARETEPDRGSAIAWALALAGRGDTVVIAGKGHEDYQIIGDKTIHFDDAETVRAILEQRL